MAFVRGAMTQEAELVGSCTAAFDARRERFPDGYARLLKFGGSYTRVPCGSCRRVSADDDRSTASPAAYIRKERGHDHLIHAPFEAELAEHARSAG